MNKLFTLLVVLTGFCLTSCLDYESRIQVKPDGSGQMIETLKFDNSMIEFIKNMASEMSDGEQQLDNDSEQEPIFNEQELREKSSKYGEGVTYVSGHAIKEGDKEGYTATYAFTDITKLTVGKESLTSTLSETESSSSEGENPPGPGGDSPLDKLNFSFSKGSPSVLTFNLLPKEDIQRAINTEPKQKETEEDSLATEMALTMMKPFIKGLRIRFIVEPIGSIIETNANHRDGSQITLLDMDFETMLENAQATRMLMDENTRPANAEEFDAFLTKTPGMKGQTGDVWIKFE